MDTWRKGELGLYGTQSEVEEQVFFDQVDVKMEVLKILDSLPASWIVLKVS